MTRLNEKEIIDLFVSRLKTDDTTRFGEDDVAILSLKKVKNTTTIPTRSLILKSDMLVESTDVPKGMLLWQVARKSIVACVSDLSAKGIKPYVCQISVGIPKKYSKTEIVDLVDGFQIASREFNIKIVGGDTNESKELVIDCCMIGFSDNNEADIPRRNGAKPGDLVVVSGEFGYSSSGLKILIRNADAPAGFKNKAVLSVIKPQPQQKFGILLAEYFSSSIDSSDGFAISLYELARRSKVDFVINNIPSAKGLECFAKDNNLDATDLIFHGGEEYEIVATIPRSNMKIVKSVVKAAKLKLHVIGTVQKGNGKVFISNNRKKGKLSVLNDYGYIHLDN